MEKISDLEFAAYKKNKKTIAWVKAVATFFALISALLLVSEAKSLKIKKISQYFLANIDSNTTGTIINSKKINVFTRRWSGKPYKIEYEYWIEDIKYIGNLVNYKSQLKYVEELLKKYPVGKQVMVNFDSNKPEYSILEKDRLDLEFGLMFVLCIFISPLVVWGLYACFYDWND